MTLLLIVASSAFFTLGILACGKAAKPSESKDFDDEAPTIPDLRRRCWQRLY